MSSRGVLLCGGRCLIDSILETTKYSLQEINNPPEEEQQRLLEEEEGAHLMTNSCRRDLRGLLFSGCRRRVSSLLLSLI